jgi:multicomponent Na+:H+ antiporter subunit C
MIEIGLILFALLFSGVYMLTRMDGVGLALGFALLSNAVNVMILSSSGRLFDPLPGAMVLTAIVISFALTAFLIGLLIRKGELQ